MICITGATGGLGRAFALDCARRGWDLFLTDLSGASLAELSWAIHRRYGVRVYTAACDLTDAACRSALFAAVAAAGRSLGMLINVAGIDHEGLFAEKSREQLSAIVRLNVEATLDVTHAALAHAGRPFHVINVASLAAFYPMPVKATYAASKAFLLRFSLALREELRPVGGTVTALCPAGLATRPEVIRAIRAQGLAGRLTASDVGRVASRTIDAALRGRAVFVPGAFSRALLLVGRMIPQTLLAKVLGRRWAAAHRRATARAGADLAA